MLETDLAPFCSLVVLRQPRVKLTASALLAACHVAADVGDSLMTGDRLLRERGSVTDGAGNVVGAWARHVELRSPAWLTEAFAGAHQCDEYVDTLNHLFVIVLRKNLVGIHASDSTCRTRVVAAIRKGSGVLGQVKPLSPPHLSRAFALDTARTLWLSSTQPSVASRPDRKVLTGSDLEGALDPLGDQTYAYSAARWRSASAGVSGPGAFGLTPRRSQVWTRSSNSMTGFVADSIEILRRAGSKTSMLPVPLPVLAGTARLSDASVAFDATLDPSPDAEDSEFVESLLLETTAHATHGAVLDIAVDGTATGRMKLTVGESAAGVVSVAAKPVGTWIDAATSKKVQELCESSALRLFYGSGHVVADSAVHTSSMTDIPFGGWEFPVLGPGVNVKKEKPGTGSALNVAGIGAAADASLFTWVAGHWAPPGCGAGNWLTCDDAANEIADFVHVTFSPVPRVMLIHVKASKSGKPLRGISAGDYDQVAGQALKNLRSLELVPLADALERGDGRAAATFTRRNGATATRAAMVAACRAYTGRYERQVVIVQPRVRHAAHTTANATLLGGGSDQSSLNLRRLDTLLHATDAECRKLGATLRVYGAG